MKQILRFGTIQKNGPQQLGAHVDGNFITLLWSDRPGLQFPKESEISGLSPADVRAIGLPSLCPPMVSIKDDMWEDVAQDPEEIVVTIGNAFLKPILFRKANSLKSNAPCFTESIVHNLVDVSAYLIYFVCMKK